MELWNVSVEHQVCMTTDNEWQQYIVKAYKGSKLVIIFIICGINYRIQLFSAETIIIIASGFRREVEMSG